MITFKRGFILAFTSFLLLVYLYIGLYMYLCSCVLMCLLYPYMLDMIAVMQSVAPIGWHPSLLWDF